MPNNVFRACGIPPLALAAALAAPADAQVTGAALPSGDQVIARYETFLGGAAALGRVTTRTTTTRRYEQSEHPSEEVLIRNSKRPGLSIMHHEAIDGSFVRWTNGCDAAGGWVGYGSGTAPAAPQPGKATTDGVCRQEQYYYGYLPLDVAGLRQNVQRFEVRARTTITPVDAGSQGARAGGRGRDLVPAGPREVYLVLAVPAPASDPNVWLWFDVKTGALLRRADAGKGPTPTDPAQTPRFTEFLQYRNVGDGTRAPFQFVTTAPNSLVRGVETAIVDGKPIDDAVFTRPTDVARADKGL